MIEKEKQAIQNVVKYLYPETTRGPAVDNWLGGMKTLAHILKWNDCHECDGLGETEHTDCCYNCYGVGKVAP